MTISPSRPRKKEAEAAALDKKIEKVKQKKVDIEIIDKIEGIRIKGIS